MMYEWQGQRIGPPGVGVVLQDAIPTHKIISSAQILIHEEMRRLISVEFLADKFIFELHIHHNHNLAISNEI